MPNIQGLNLRAHGSEKTKLVFLYIVVAVFILCICQMGLESESMDSTYMACVGITTAIIIVSPIRVALSCICFAYPFLSVLKLPIEIMSVVTMYNLIYILRTMLSPKIGIPVQTIAAIITITVFYQIIPLMVFNQTIANIVLFTANLLMLVSAYRGVVGNKINIGLTMDLFTLGVLASCYIGRIVNPFDADWMRFTGFWTDPNFLGCFCLIGIAVCLNHVITRKNPIIWLVVLVGLAYYGFLTISRAYVVVMAIMAVVYFFSSLKRGGKIGWKFLIIVIFLSIVALPHVQTLLEIRGFDENNLTNNRTELSLLLLDAVSSHMWSLLTGIGYDNDHGFWETLQVSKSMASHNSFVDYFAYFGSVGVIITLLIIIKRSKVFWLYFKSLVKIENMPYLVMLLYSGTLSMLKYAFFFLLLGLFIAENRKSVKAISY